MLYYVILYYVTLYVIYYIILYYIILYYIILYYIIFNIKTFVSPYRSQNCINLMHFVRTFIPNLTRYVTRISNI